MAQITIWGDFKANNVENLNLSGSLQLLLNQSNINVVNFEAPVKCKEKAIRKSGPNISQDTAAPKWLEVRGFNVISLANNHAMDFGADGLRQTEAMFQNAHVIGVGSWENAYKMYVVTTDDGIRVGFLAATHCEFGTLVDKKRDQYGCSWCQHPDFEKLILRKKDVDYLVILNHGGIEYMDMPLPEWRILYRKWIDWGADAVVASHPHVPQGYEIYQGKLICYSLGNFCFQTNNIKHNHWLESLCCVINVEKNGKSNFAIHPIYYNAKNNYIDFNHSIDFTKHLIWLNESLKDEETYMNYVNKFVVDLYGHYGGLFTRGGWLASIFSKEFLKGIIEGFKNEHIYNCINCESHRCTLMRAMRLKFNI